MGLSKSPELAPITRKKELAPSREDAKDEVQRRIGVGVGIGIGIKGGD